MVTIRTDEPRDEVGWVRCRVLSFLDSAFWDAVERTKERYEHPAIELVAEEDGAIVGLLDVECETPALADRPGRGGMIWQLALHPDHQRQGVAAALLNEAERHARGRGLERLEAWTLDDARVQRYLHVYLECADLRQYDGELRLVKAFAHYTGDEPERIRRRYARVHDDVLYEKRL